MVQLVQVGVGDGLVDRTCDRLRTPRCRLIDERLDHLPIERGQDGGVRNVDGAAGELHRVLRGPDDGRTYHLGGRFDGAVLLSEQGADLFAKHRAEVAVVLVVALVDVLADAAGEEDGLHRRCRVPMGS